MPALSPDGYLPPGRHSATLDEVEATFVDAAPFRDRRLFIFAAFRTYLLLLQEIFPTGRLWLDGGFVSHKAWEPADVDLLMIVPDAALAALDATRAQKLTQLLTLQSVSATILAVPMPRVQPMGGLIDAFIAVSSDLASMHVYDQTWSSVTDVHKQVVPGKVKGYLEVAW